MIAQPSRRTRGHVDRRTALRTAVLATGALAGAAALPGCATPEDRANDPEAQRLRTAAQQARADSDAARALAVLDGAGAAALRTVADQRAQHATALSDEFSRYVQRTTAIAAAPSSAAANSNQPTKEALIAQLKSSANTAADAAVAASGYQAGLLGSIAAATRVHAEVVLA